jgi:hypothetical protein
MQKVRHESKAGGNVKKSSQLQARKFSRNFPQNLYPINLLLGARDK